MEGGGCQLRLKKVEWVKIPLKGEKRKLARTCNTMKRKVTQNVHDTTCCTLFVGLCVLLRTTLDLGVF